MASPLTAAPGTPALRGNPAPSGPPPPSGNPVPSGNAAPSGNPTPFLPDNPRAQLPASRESSHRLRAAEAVDEWRKHPAYPPADRGSHSSDSPAQFRSPTELSHRPEEDEPGRPQRTRPVNSLRALAEAAAVAAGVALPRQAGSATASDAMPSSLDAALDVTATALRHRLGRASPNAGAPASRREQMATANPVGAQLQRSAAATREAEQEIEAREALARELESSAARSSLTRAAEAERWRDANGLAEAPVHQRLAAVDAPATARDTPPRTIKVQIGRITVRAPAPAPARPERRGRAAPRVPLSEYLRRREGDE